MKCPKCSSDLRKVQVAFEGAKRRVLSYQCANPDCIYFEFEEASSKKVLAELEENNK